MLQVKGQIVFFGMARPETELGATEMDDVIFVEQAIAIHSLPIDKGAVGAAFVRDTQFAADVVGQTGVKTTQAKVGDHEIIFLASPDPTGQVSDCKVDSGICRLQRPLFFQFPNPPRCAKL